jgi:hypothetical protein
LRNLILDDAFHPDSETNINVPWNSFEVSSCRSLRRAMHILFELQSQWEDEQKHKKVIAPRGASASANNAV